MSPPYFAAWRPRRLRPPGEGIINHIIVVVVVHSAQPSDEPPIASADRNTFTLPTSRVPAFFRWLEAMGAAARGPPSTHCCCDNNLRCAAAASKRGGRPPVVSAYTLPHFFVPAIAGMERTQQQEVLAAGTPPAGMGALAAAPVLIDFTFIRDHTCPF